MKFIVPILLALTFSLLTSCYPGGTLLPHGYDLIHISGTVVDVNGDPISDASVDLTTLKLDYDYFFIFFYLPSGHTEVTIRNGMTDANGEIDLLVDRHEMNSNSLIFNGMSPLMQAQYTSQVVTFEEDEVFDETIDLQITLRPVTQFTIVNNSVESQSGKIYGDHVVDLDGSSTSVIKFDLNAGESTMFNFGLGQRLRLKSFGIDSTFLLTQNNSTYELN